MASKKEISELQALAAKLPNARQQFIRDVNTAAGHVSNIAESVANAIGEISIDEAKDAMVREFAAKLLKQ